MPLQLPKGSSHADFPILSLTFPTWQQAVKQMADDCSCQKDKLRYLRSRVQMAESFVRGKCHMLQSEETVKRRASSPLLLSFRHFLFILPLTHGYDEDR